MSPADVLTFAANHLDLLELAAEAIAGGVPKEHLVEVIKREMTEASDALMNAELK